MVNLFTTPLGPGLVLLLAALALTFVRRTLPRLVPLVMALLAVIVAGVAVAGRWLELAGGELAAPARCGGSPPGRG